MTQYVMSVYGPAQIGDFGNYGTEEAMRESLAATEAFNDRLRAEGRFVFAQGLADATTATVVDGQGEQPIFTDGPYLESKEYVAGFWIIEAADDAEARTLAAEASKACRGTVEVRATQGPPE